MQQVRSARRRGCGPTRYVSWASPSVTSTTRCDVTTRTSSRPRSTDAASRSSRTCVRFLRTRVPRTSPRRYRRSRRVAGMSCSTITSCRGNRRGATRGARAATATRQRDAHRGESARSPRPARVSLCTGRHRSRPLRLRPAARRSRHGARRARDQRRRARAVPTNRRDAAHERRGRDPVHHDARAR